MQILFLKKAGVIPFHYNSSASNLVSSLSLQFATYKT